MFKNYLIRAHLMFFLSCGVFASSSSLIAEDFEISKSDRAKLDVDIKKRAKRSKYSAAPKASAGKSQLYLFKGTKKLIANQEKTIALINRKVKKHKAGSPIRLRYVMQILEANVENALLREGVESKEYDKKYARWASAGSKGKAPKISNKGSRSKWIKVVKLSNAVLEEYPKSKRAPEILFRQAFAYDQLGKSKTAAQKYSLLVGKYKTSPFSGEAHYLLGEYFYNRSDYRSALNSYKSATSYRTSRAYGNALSKIGWCEFNLGDPKSALTSWRKTVLYAKSQGKKGQDLKETTMRDMVYGFAQLGDEFGALAFYNANDGKKYIAPLLKLLSEELADRGSLVKAISVARRLQKEQPYSAEAPEVQKFIIELTSDLGVTKPQYRAQLWKELGVYGQKYGPKSTWARRNVKDKLLVTETQKDIRDQMLYYAKITHKSANETGNDNQLKIAKEGYQLFLKNYPTAVETPEIRYYLGDIEYELENYREAGRNFYSVVAAGKKKAFQVKDGKKLSIHKQNADLMLAAYKDAFREEFEILQKVKPTFKGPAKKLGINAKNYISACGAYHKYYPKDKKVSSECDSNITQIYYRSNDKKLARKYMLKVARLYPSLPVGEDAVENLIPLYKGERKLLITRVNELLKIPQYAKGDLGSRLRQLRRGAEIDDIVATKDTSKRAKRYEQAALKSPNAKDADRLWFNAAADYYKNGRPKDAIRCYSTIIKNYPKSKLLKDSIYNSATIQAERYSYQSAAKYFRLYASRYKDEKTTKSIANACELSAAGGVDQAWGYCLSYAKIKPAEAAVSMNRMIHEAYLKRDLDKVNQYTSQIQKVMKLDPNESIEHQYFLYKLQGSKSNSAPAQRMVQIYKQNSKNIIGLALSHVGEIYYKKASSGYRQYFSLRLKGGKVEDLQKSIEGKFAALNQVKNNYAPLLQMGDPYWGIAALHDLGYVHSSFAKLMSDPPPVNGATRKEVQDQLAGNVKDLNTEAMRNYNLGVSAAKKGNIYNDSLVKIQSAILDVKGKRQTTDQVITQSDLVSSDAPNNLL